MTAFCPAVQARSVPAVILTTVGCDVGMATSVVDIVLYLSPLSPDEPDVPLVPAFPDVPLVPAVPAAPGAPTWFIVQVSNVPVPKFEVDETTNAPVDILYDIIVAMK